MSEQTGWKRLGPDTPLPARNAHETQWLDFKAQPGGLPYEAAKDVAAFANGAGGTLLVGAVGGDTLRQYHPMTLEDAQAEMRRYEETVRDLLRPRPVVDLQRIPVDGGFVVAVNVEPLLGQVVGIRIMKPATNLEDLFLYPRRVGTQTVFITPEQLPMFVDAKARRIAVLLEQIVENRVLLRTPASLDGQYYTSRGVLRKVEATENTVEIGNFDGSSATVCIPLDMVESVARGFREPWQLFVRGKFVTGNDDYFFVYP